ncbi:cupin domain-containing protein [Luteibacter aegosomatis]|uniref:cupin domain-containing protein n=1 Tax=Luteibacter aegosomatis TaxID=2911537 RepID=UPI001FF9F420|nr:cupin domain-containing protein [Luteibacter aegosomatis]UPG86682.1 cupin domain-containing protein [Luteibacter aegosomatis]
MRYRYLACLFAALALPSAIATASTVRETVNVNFSHELPNVPGKKLMAVEVVYPPGAASLPHHHAGSAFIYAYVVSGGIVSEVDGGGEKTYTAGQSFYEAPGSHHQVSRNVSTTEPAKLLAVFVVDGTDTHLTTPDK